MKQGNKPTRKQKIVIQSAGFNLENWLVERDTPSELILIHRYAATTKVIRKGA